jgi:D-amino peptidase
VSQESAYVGASGLSLTPSAHASYYSHQDIFMARTLCCLLLLLPCLATAQHKLNVYISADGEGIAGVTTWEVQAEPKGREYQQFRRLMTEEVNAAVGGAFDAGATQVMVSDSHGDGQNIDVELLDKRASLVRSFPRPLLMMQGIDNSFDAVVFIGYHASEGQPGAVLSHTLTGHRILQIKLNGTPVSEGAFNAALAGDFGVPVVFLSGDQLAGAEIQHALGPIETAATKQAIGFNSAVMVHPEKVRQLIREGVKRGISRRTELKPYKLAEPVTLEVVFKQVLDAEVFSYLPNVQRPEGHTIRFTGRDMVEVTKFLAAVLLLNPS